MLRFLDRFTGTVYEMGPQWLQKVRGEVAACIRTRLNEEIKGSADAVARFWSDEYYTALFPLRFGLSEDEHGLLGHRDLYPESDPINLETQAGQPLRWQFQDGNGLPPLLPAMGEEETSELLADRLLSRAALANVILRQRRVDPEALHAVRLAFLTYPLLDELEDDLSRWPDLLAVARFLAGQTGGDLPWGLEGGVLAAWRDGSPPLEATVYLVLVAAQRIKRYVFETPGLNEIRGASTLLDALIEEGKEAVGGEIGPEVVLRAVGSTLLFLAPAPEDEHGLPWDERLRRAFYTATGTPFVAATTVGVPARDLLDRYPEAIRQAYQGIREDRAKAQLPIYETLPFEARCVLCHTRPAEGWVDLADEGPAPVCRPCRAKRQQGRSERPGLVRKMLEWVGIQEEQGVSKLGVQGGMAQSIGPVSQEGFIPDRGKAKARRALLATVYGDGNNFGAVGQNLSGLAMGLQWTRRVERVTKVAAALALARATQETAQERGWQPGGEPVLPRIPFQVLALGGDDLSLLAWGPVGIRFARHFLAMVDLEFRQGSKPEPSSQPIAFSLGVLVADYKAAVRRTVDFAEEELLGWAKRAFRESGLKQGNVAMLLATSPEQIPTDLESYRARMYLRSGESTRLCLTLRPFTQEELGFLLDKADELRRRGHLGRLHRLVAALVTSPPLVGMLHYLYQRARSGDGEDSWMRSLEEGPLPASLEGLRAHYPAAVLEGRHPFGLMAQADGKVRFSPLWDLLEIVKVLE